MKNRFLTVFLSSVFVLSFFLISNAWSGEAGSQSSVDNTETIPFKKDAMFSKSQILKVILGFLVAIGAASIFLYYLRRYYYGNDTRITQKRMIAVREVRKLSAKTTLLLVSVGRKSYLLAQHGESLQVIDTYDDENALNIDTVSENKDQ